MIFDAKPAIIGHRGYGAGHGGRYSENTLDAFAAAARSGIPWVELDVRRSIDGTLMVWHDPLTRSGAAIVGSAAAALAAEGIASLPEVLAALPASVAVDVDVKTVLEDAIHPPDQRTHALVAEFLLEYQGTRQFLITSFDVSLPCYLADRGVRSDRTALGLLAEVRSSAGPAISAVANLGLDAVCLHTSSLHPGNLREGARNAVETAHRAGLEIMVWTPEPSQAVEFADAGVDAVCVDDIPGTQAALGQHGRDG